MAEAGAEAAPADLDGGRPPGCGAPHRTPRRWLDGLGRLAHQPIFSASVPILKEALAANGRDPENFPISKRIFMAVDENPAVARRELARWFDDVYFNPPGTEQCGLYGTPEQVRERLEEMVGMGANHLMLNPVSRHAEQLEALAEVVGFK